MIKVIYLVIALFVVLLFLGCSGAPSEKVTFLNDENTSTISIGTFSIQYIDSEIINKEIGVDRGKLSFDSGAGLIYDALRFDVDKEQLSTFVEARKNASDSIKGQDIGGLVHIDSLTEPREITYLNRSMIYMGINVEDIEGNTFEIPVYYMNCGRLIIQLSDMSEATFYNLSCAE